MRKTDEQITPVRKTTSLSLAPNRAFELFARRMGEWWPLPTHSITAERSAGVRFEEQVGGRVVELVDDGTEHAWADVLAWDPPHRLVLAWHPVAVPIAASILEVRFDPSGSGSRVSLEHRGWDEFGIDEGTSMREQYDPGWDMVLAPFLDLVETEISR